MRRGQQVSEQTNAPTERSELRDLRENLEEVCLQLKSLNERGYQIAFHLNVPNGTVDNFMASRLVPVDLNDA